MYLSEADVPGQQQHKQRTVAQLREEQHEASDRAAGRGRCHQTETREAGDVDDHVTVRHLIGCDDVHAVPGDVSYKQQATTPVCKRGRLTLSDSVTVDSCSVFISTDITYNNVQVASRVKVKDSRTSSAV